ncbi:MAG: hypothetical protein ACQEQA_02530 [Bacillota bacterium]
MDKTYNSLFLTKKQFTISILVLGIFTGAAAYLLINAFYRGEHWYVFVDSELVRYLFLYIVGVAIAALYFGRDYYFVNALEVSFEDEFIHFKGHWINKRFHVADLRDFRPSRVIYGWFKKEKLIFRFKDRSDNRKYQMFLILEKTSAPEFEKALVEARKKVVEDS